MPVVLLASFSTGSQPQFDIKTIRKDFVKIQSDLYVCRYEVSNEAYHVFIDALKTADAPDYTNYLPVDSKLEDDNYRDHPVAGISYEAANAYCSWLTQQYNKDSGRKFDKVLFRLLNKEEWIFAANKGNTEKVYTWGTGFIQNNRGQYLCNFKHTIFVYDSAAKKYNEFPDTSVSAASPGTVPVKYYFPNSFGLYNMCGNVAEMVSEKGLAKGGAFTDPAYKVRIATEERYTAPDTNIGFRICMQVIAK